MLDFTRHLKPDKQVINTLKLLGNLHSSYDDKKD